MPYYNGCGLYTFLYKLQELCVNIDIFSFFFFPPPPLINGILRHSDNILIKVTARSEKSE